MVVLTTDTDVVPTVAVVGQVEVVEPWQINGLTGSPLVRFSTDDRTPVMVILASLDRPVPNRNPKLGLVI